MGICKLFVARGGIGTSSIVFSAWTVVTSRGQVGIYRGFTCQSLPHPWGIVKTTSANSHIAQPRPVLGVVGRDIDRRINEMGVVSTEMMTTSTQRFHSRCGANINLSDNNTIARRVRSNWNGKGGRGNSAHTSVFPT